MTVHTTIAGFGYQDFILVRAAPDDVVWAMGRALADADASIREPDPAIARPSPLLQSLLRAVGLAPTPDHGDGTWHAPAPEPLLPYRLFRGGEAAGAPLTRTAPPAYGSDDPADLFTDGWDDVRVSRVAGEEDLMLVEMRELASSFSSHAFGLSMHLPETDILYFRRSGSAAAERHHDFHLYRSGETLRRVLSHATWPHGDPAQEWWEGLADGAATRYEPPGLYDGATEADLLTAGALDVILGGFGLNAETLFSAGATRAPVLFSRRAGGDFLPA